MKETKQYLDAVKQKEKIDSDYGLAKFLGIKTQAVSNYRHGRSVPDDYVATKIAEALNLNPMEIITAVNAERAKRVKDAEKIRFWKARWEKVSQHTVTIFLGTAALTHSVGGYVNCILC